MKRVAVIIVTFNRLQMLKEEITSVRKQTFDSFDIIVVNNGSTDDTPNWLSEQPDIITITQDNLGCTGGMFTGIKYAVENGYELCWVMDDDVEYKNNSLEELIKSYDLLQGNVGFLCSKVEGIDGKPMNVPNVDNRPLDNGYSHYYDLVDRQMIKVIDATFVSLFFSSNVVKNVGLPLKEFFIWGDDTEFTTRITKRYRGYLCCNSIAIHKRVIQSDLSFETENDKKRLRNYFYMFRNRAFINRRDGGIRSFLKTYIKYVLLFVCYLFKFDSAKSMVLLRVLMKSPGFKPMVVFPK